MYNFIFWFFYKYFEWKNKDESNFIPSALVVFTLSIHLFLVYSLVRFFTGINYLSFKTTLSYGERKFLLLPFVLLIFFVVWYFYYKPRTSIILENYKEKKPFTIRNYFYLFLIIILPLILAIQFTNSSL